MALEDLTGSNKFINNLVNTNPVGATDPVSQGDDHIRGIKNVLLNTFPNITGQVTVTQAQLNAVGTPAAVQCPIGMVADFAGTAIPAGWLALPFAASNVSRTTYAELFAAIGTTWGAGDGSSTFGLPWVMDGGASLNHATAGAETAGAVKTHTHGYNNVQGGGSAISGSSANLGVATVQTSGMTPAGNANNLAAGSYFRKCIRYQ
jgi:microcystin-dependent protein